MLARKGKTQDPEFRLTLRRQESGRIAWCWGAGRRRPALGLQVAILIHRVWAFRVIQVFWHDAEVLRMRMGMGTAALSEGRPDATTLMPRQKLVATIRFRCKQTTSCRQESSKTKAKRKRKRKWKVKGVKFYWWTPGSHGVFKRQLCAARSVSIIFLAKVRFVPWDPPIG